VSVLHVWPQDLTEGDGQITTSAILEYPDGERKELWYKLPLEHKNNLAVNHDSFLLGGLFEAMRYPALLEVHGEVSPSLLRNLDEFQEVWALWSPETYSKVEMLAETEIEPLRPGEDSAITAFSMGVDACYSAFSHARKLRGRSWVNLKAGLFVHGFLDYPIIRNDEFDRAKITANSLLDSLGLELIPMSTNIRYLLRNWPDTHGIALAACISQLSGAYTQGLIPSSNTYKYPRLNWGSTPLTDQMFSSRSFEIVHDGGNAPRTKKIKTIADWPEAMESLQVCNNAWQHDRNCSRCGKCIRTALGFRVQGIDLPVCFDHDPTIADILKLRFRTNNKDYLDLLEVGRESSPGTSWFRAYETVYRYNHTTSILRYSKLGQAIKRFFIR